MRRKKGPLPFGYIATSDGYLEEVPQELWHIYFDMCVNMGKRTAVKILQRAAVNKGRDIEVDGGLGPATRKALKGVELDRVRAFRVKYYVDIITSKHYLKQTVIKLLHGTNFCH